MKGNERNMKIIILTTFLSVVSGTELNPPPRSVNVNLETSFLFDPKDLNDNISFIQNIKTFLDKLYKILAPQAQEVQLRASENNTERRTSSFTDFLKKLGDSFIAQEDPTVKAVANTFKNQIFGLFDSTKSAVNSALPDEGMKQYIKNTIIKWTENAKRTKNQLRRAMTDSNPLLTTFVRRLNDYYTEHDVKKLNKYLKKLNHNMENDLDSTKIVKDAVDFGIQEKLKKLNATSKVSLMNDMKLLSDYVRESQSKEKTQVDLRRANVVPTNDKELPNSGNDSLDKDEIYNELKRTIGKKLRLANEKMKENEKKGVKANEIFVDNMEMLVQSRKKPDPE